MIKTCQDEGRVPPSYNAEVPASTINRYVNVMQAFLTLAKPQDKATTERRNKYTHCMRMVGTMVGSMGAGIHGAVMGLSARQAKDHPAKPFNVCNVDGTGFKLKHVDGTLDIAVIANVDKDLPAKAGECEIFQLNLFF
jgi:hypothetical protein